MSVNMIIMKCMKCILNLLHFLLGKFLEKNNLFFLWIFRESSYSQGIMNIYEKHFALLSFLHLSLICCENICIVFSKINNPINEHKNSLGQNHISAIS